LIDAAVRELIRSRAGHRCEYCHLRQADLPYSTFQVEHVRPRKHGGSDDPANLALACDRCNLCKGSNLAGIDPETGELTALFDPRAQSWEEHFSLTDVTIVGLTAVGRTTVRVLNMNEARRMRLRAALKRHGFL
jgi:5-methylcytosine-specific restriction endonuclease McrA